MLPLRAFELSCDPRFKLVLPRGHEKKKVTRTRAFRKCMLVLVVLVLVAAAAAAVAVAVVAVVVVVVVAAVVVVVVAAWNHRVGGHMYLLFG